MTVAEEFEGHKLGDENEDAMIHYKWVYCDELT